MRSEPKYFLVNYTSASGITARKLYKQRYAAQRLADRIIDAGGTATVYRALLHDDDTLMPMPIRTA
jgi:hypothetical protein